MAAEGLECVPQDVQEMVIFDEATGADGLERGSDDWVARYRFDISTAAFSQEMVVNPGSCTEVRIELEQEFVYTNRKRLDAFKASQG